MLNISYINGKKIVNRNLVSVYNGSFLYGINCFEGIRAYWDSSMQKIKIFDLDEHFQRLYDSAQYLKMTSPVTKVDLETELHHILRSEQIKEDVYIRITFFIDGETSWSEQEQIAYIISIRNMTSQLGTAVPQTLGWSTYRRIAANTMPPSIKAGANYLNSRYALLDAKSRGFEGALFLSEQGYVSESTGSCIFFIKEGTLYTPSVDSDILIGVTRNRIIKLAEQMGIPVLEKLIKPEEVNTFEAAFLAGTMIELKPISRIENKVFESKHPIYQQITEKLKKYVYGLEF